MRIINVTPEMTVLPLGRLGENESTKFIFDVSDWLEQYPDATIGLANKLPHASASYPCTLEEEEDGKVSWTITSAELSVEGKGKCQLQAVEGSTVEKKKIYTTDIGEALDPDADPPEEWESYVTAVTALKGDAEDAAEDAEAYAVGKRGGVDVDSDDPAYHNNAKYYAETVDPSIKADKVSGATSGNFAALDGNGNLTDSGHKHSDYLTSHQDITGKADKVTSATNGNFAGLDSNGNLTDSGKKASDFLTSHQDITGKADKVSSATENNFAALDSNGNLKDSGKKASDFLTGDVVSGKADKVSGATSGNLAGLDGNGNLTDSGKSAGDFLLDPSTAGTEGQVLTSDGEGGYSWEDPTGGDPTSIIDDTAGDGDTDKVWSADKSHELLNQVNSKMDEPSAEGSNGQVLTTDGNGGRTWTTPSGGGGHDVPSGGTSGQVLGKASNTDYDLEWKTVSGGGTVDSSLSENSTNPVQNKVLTKEIRKAELVKNDLSAWLYAENKYLNASYELTDLTGFNLYRIPCEHLDYVSLLWTGSTPFGTLGNQYRYTFEDNNGYRRDLTSYNIKFESGKVMFIAPSNAIAIYFCFKADTLANLSVIKNTPREYAPANDVAKSFIIPINNKTAVNAGFYLTNANSGIYTWDNASYPIWWIKVGKGDTIKFKDNVSGLSYNAVQMNTSDTIATISAKEYTFTTDAVVCIFEQASNPNNCVIIPVGSKLQIDASNIYNSPFENTFNGVNGVAFGTSLTYRAQTTGGYLQYLPALSGITFDNQGIGSSVILGDGGNYDMLAKIKSYTGYSGKKVCILEGFVNDWYNYKTLGTWKDTAETSVCGCVRSALNYILSQNANITVFLVLDPYGRNYDNVDCSSTAVNESSLTQYEYYSEIAKVAESLGIPVIKMFAESQISENTPQFMLDNIHPNALGAKQSAYFIWSKMKQYYANQVS